MPFERLHLFVIQLAGVGQREIQQQVAVLAHDVGEQIDDFLGGLVFLSALVVPPPMQVSVCHGLAAMPIGDAALVIEHAGADCAVGRQLAGVDGLGRSAVQLRADVVEMRDHLQAVLLEGQMAIGVEQVGLIFVDEVGHAVEIVLPPRIGNASRRSIRLQDRRTARMRRRDRGRHTADRRRHKRRLPAGLSHRTCG